MRWEPPPADLRLAPDGLHVWRIAISPPVFAAERELSADERERAARFHFERDRRRFVAAHVGLRRILQRYLDAGELRLSAGPYGKPLLAGARLRFNLSHSGELALVAVALDREVGVDVEERGDLPHLEVARDHFSPRERGELARLPPPVLAHAFYLCWTRKEAFIKALGLGLARALDSFDVSLTPGEPAALQATRPDAGEAVRWRLYDLEVAEGYAGAVAIAGDGARLETFALPDLVA